MRRQGKGIAWAVAALCALYLAGVVGVSAAAAGTGTRQLFDGRLLPGRSLAAAIGVRGSAGDLVPRLVATKLTNACDRRHRCRSRLSALLKVAVTNPAGMTATRSLSSLRGGWTLPGGPLPADGSAVRYLLRITLPRAVGDQAEGQTTHFWLTWGGWNPATGSFIPSGGGGNGPSGASHAGFGTSTGGYPVPGTVGQNSLTNRRQPHHSPSASGTETITGGAHAEAARPQVGASDGAWLAAVAGGLIALLALFLIIFFRRRRRDEAPAAS